MKNFQSPYPCICCDLEGEGLVTYHHEYAQKSWPEHKYKVWNLVSLCKIHHDMCHNNGTIPVSEKFPSLEKWLIDHGWEVCPLMERWIHPHE